MRIAFVYPATEFDKQYHADGLPVGLLYLSAVLERDHGVKVDIFDERHGPAVPDASQLNNYDVIGFTSMSMQAMKALQLARQVRDSGFDGSIVFGGSHSSVAPGHLREQPFIDAVFIGEAEESFPRYLEYLQGRGSRLERCWVRDARREWIHYAGGCFVKDLDTLPFPAREKYGNLARRIRFINMTTTRGCPHKCNYCQPTKQILFGKTVRKRSVSNILAEIEDAIERFAINSFSIDDDTFTFNKKRVCEFSERVKPLGLRWSCQSRSDIDRETLTIMRDSGFHMVFVGAESGSQRVLDMMDKKNSVDNNRRFIRHCKELGIDTWCNMMIGYPGETRRDMELSLDFVLETRPSRVCVSQVTPFPGTYLWEKNRKDVIVDDWNEMARHVQRPKFHSMKKQQRLIEFYMAMMSKEYGQPLLADFVPATGLPGSVLARFPLTLEWALRKHNRYMEQLRQGLEAVRSGEVENGLLALESLARRFPHIAEAFLHLGLSYLEHNRSQDALRVLDSLGVLLPGDTEVHFLLGRALHGVGNRDRALEELRTVVRLNPRHLAAVETLKKMEATSGKEQGLDCCSH